MKSFKVILSSIVDVETFVNRMSQYEFSVDLVSGRNVVNAKSLMAIFSLDLSEPIIVRAYTEETTELEKSLKDFLA